MTIEEALVAYLEGVAGLSALVGARIYPLVLPQGAELPALTYQRISGPRIHSHSGPSGLASPRIQFNCWAESYSAAKAVAVQLRYALDGFRGTMEGIRAAGSIDNDLDDYEPETGRWRVIVDAIIWHEEATS